MARAQGARAQMALAFESVYGTPPPAGDFWRMPFASSNLGAEQPLLSSELLGYGRDPLAPVKDAITADGDVVVPIDARFFGIWLKAAFGDPITAGSVAATGSFVFSAQPVASSTITIAGTAFTFVASAPTGNQIQIGANLAATLTNMVTVLNASVVPAVAAATYSQTGGTTLVVTHDTLGPAGNAFTLAASSAPASNATVSGATLSGGANGHEFRSGGWTLPSMSIEIGNPDVPSYRMNSGCVVNTLSWTMNRSGLITATAAMVARGETPAAASLAGALNDLTLSRFGAFNGSVKRNGVQLANITSAEISYTNNLDRIETIRNDGMIDGADPSVAACTGNMNVRFADTTLLTDATNGTPCALEFSYALGNGLAFTFTAHEVYLPKPKLPLEGPGGVQSAFAWQAARNAATGRMVTAVLTNDMVNYANP